MENNNSLSVLSDSQVKPKHAWWKLGTLGWILIFGLIVLNIGIFAGIDNWNKQTIGRILYLIDPRYWSLLPVPILWSLVCWFVTDFLCRFDFIRRYRLRIRLIIVAAVFCAIAVLTGRTLRVIRMYIYYNLYMAYIVGPIANYMVTGIWSWKMLIAPTMTIITIVVLLFIAYKHRRQKL
jgi:hypothetical protein